MSANSRKLLVLPDSFEKGRLASVIDDDFNFYTDTELWTKLAADGSATVTHTNDGTSQILLTTGGTDNNEVMVRSTQKVFLFADAQGFRVDFLIQYSEAATNAANVAVGVSSAFAANLLVDDGAGPATTMSGLMIYKADGGTVWKCLSSLGTAQTITTSTTTAGGTTAQLLSVQFKPVSATLGECSFFCNGIPLLDASQTSRNVEIKHNAFTYTSAVAMYAGVYVKCGTGTSQTLKLDRIVGAYSR